MIILKKHIFGTWVRRLHCSMKRFLRLYSIEQKMFLRSGDVFLFNLCMPVVALVLIALIAGGKVAQGEMTYLQSAFASLITVGICCSAFMSIPIVMVDYRDKKVLKSFYCSPCSPVWLLGADTLCSAIMATVSAILVASVAIICFGYRMQGNTLAFIGAWFLTLVSMFSIGLMIASLCKTVRSMNVVTSLVYFPMLLFSGAMIPYELFPRPLQIVADIMPLSQGIKLMKQISMNSCTNSLKEIMIMVIITIVCTFVSIKSFRWE